MESGRIAHFKQASAQGLNLSLAQIKQTTHTFFRSIFPSFFPLRVQLS